MALSVGARGTGKRGTHLLCLCYNTEVTTNIGRLCIGDIVEQKLPVKVLAFDHKRNVVRWQNIDNYEVSPGRPCVRVTLNDGRVIDATTDHPFYVVGRGYVPAAQLTNTDKVITNEIYLRSLREGIQAPRSTCSPFQASLLQSELSLYVEQRREQSELSRGFSRVHLRGVWQRVQAPSLTRGEMCASPLQPDTSNCMVKAGKTNYFSNSNVRSVRERVQAQAIHSGVLQASLLQQCMSEYGSRGYLRDVQEGIQAHTKSNSEYRTHLLQSRLPLCTKEQITYFTQPKSRHAIYLRGVWEGIRSVNKLCSSSQTPLLQPHVPRYDESWREQSRLSWRQHDRCMRSLWKNVLCSKISIPTREDGILLGILQSELSERRAVSNLSQYIRQLCLLRKANENYGAQSRKKELLFSGVCQFITQRSHQRREQSTIRRRGIGQPIPIGISSLSTSNQGTRWSSMCSLPSDTRRKWQGSGCASHQLQHPSQCFDESCHTVSMVSWEDAWIGRAALPVETLLVRCVEPIPTPEYVYNLRVVEDHNYFANGVLTHNCDDPNSATAGKSELENTINWFGNTWMSRLNSYDTGAMIVVGQRIEERDLTGHILSLGGWEHLVLPTEYEPTRHCFTSIGFEDKRKEEGELLWPEKFPAKVLDTLKNSLGALNYAAQFQQSPAPAGGHQFKEKWFRYFDIKDEYYALETDDGIRHVAIEDCWRFTVVDLAISTKQSADYTVIQTYDVTPQNDLLLIDMLRGHFSNPEQQKLIRTTYFRLRPRFIQIESIAYQLAIIQQLRDNPIEPVTLDFNPVKVGDFFVKTGNPESLDRTLRSLPNIDASVIKDEHDSYVMHNGYSVVRVYGDIYFFRYACEKQGYCTIVRDVLPEDLQEMDQKARRRYSLPITEYKPVRDKVSRASAPALLMEKGKFYFLKTLPDLHIVKTEHLTFPKGTNDDSVDCSSQAADVIFSPVQSGPLIWSPDTPVEMEIEQSQSKSTSSLWSAGSFEEEGTWFESEVDRWG